MLKVTYATPSLGLPHRLCSELEASHLVGSEVYQLTEVLIHHFCVPKIASF